MYSCGGGVGARDMERGHDRVRVGVCDGYACVIKACGWCGARAWVGARNARA